MFQASFAGSRYWSGVSDCHGPPAELDASDDDDDARRTRTPSRCSAASPGGCPARDTAQAPKSSSTITSSQTLRILIARNPACAAESWSERMTVITPVSRGDLGERAGGKPELRADLSDELAQVERDDPVCRIDAVPGLVLEHVHELVVRHRARLDEARLHPWPRQQEVDALRGRLAQRRRSGCREGLEILRQPLPERSAPRRRCRRAG